MNGGLLRRDYPEPANQGVGEYHKPTMKKQLEDQKRQLEERLDRVNKALNGLNDHPEAAELLEAIAQVL